ncbi:MAG: poly-gamma-glutamate synthesis protein (capsule biosynthesis protein), partial [Acidimicrobiaceae bacterium]
VAPIIGAADLAICHLETPVAPPGQPLSTFPLYGVPAEIAAGIASAGYDRCSTASNHSLDRGTAGIDATVAALEMNGLGQSGMARSPDEVTAPVVTVAGIAVAHLSYTYGFNGLALPAAEPWRANPIDPVRIVADALDARVRGAEIVIVSLHWGVEKVVAPTAYQREVAATITASGAVDLIVGHHAHVLQPIEVINGRWVVFGLGNSLSNMPTGDSWPASTQDGAVLTVTIEQQPDGSLAVQQPVVIPTWVDRDGGFVIRPVLSDLADPSVSDGVKAELAASLARTTAVLGPFIATT